MIWSALLTVCLCFWVTVAACVLPEQVPQVLPELSKQALTREDFNLSLLARANREASYLPDQFASVHVHDMPELADVEGGLPILLPPATRPLTGQEFMLRWVTRAVAVYPEGVPESYDPANRIPPDWWTIPTLETYHPALRPDLPCALLITLEQPSPPASIPGAAGAMMQVPPDYILVPDRILEPHKIAPHNRPGVPFEFVQDEYGKIMLRLTIPFNINGLRVWCQLLVADYRVPAGCVSTPMVELNIGSR
jgi:hypothetical protein